MSPGQATTVTFGQAFKLLQSIARDCNWPPCTPRSSDAREARAFETGITSLSELDMLTRFTKIYSFFSAEMKRQLFKVC
jgi:hypothetical protein